MYASKIISDTTNIHAAVFGCVAYHLIHSRDREELDEKHNNVSLLATVINYMNLKAVGYTSLTPRTSSYQEMLFLMS